MQKGTRPHRRGCRPSLKRAGRGPPGRRGRRPLGPRRQGLTLAAAPPPSGSCFAMDGRSFRDVWASASQSPRFPELSGEKGHFSRNFQKTATLFWYTEKDLWPKKQKYTRKFAKKCRNLLQSTKFLCKIEKVGSRICVKSQERSSGRTRRGFDYGQQGISGCCV